MDEDIDRYLNEMDEADAQEPQEKKLTTEELREKIEEMKRRRVRAEEMEKQLDENGQSQISLTDSDSRMILSAGGAGPIWGTTSRCVWMLNTSSSSTMWNKPEVDI